MTHSARLIVLHTLKYTDSSLLVYAYTDLFGRQTYLLRGIRTVKKHGAAAHFFPLHILEAEVYHKQGASIHHIKEFHTTNALQGIRTHLHKSAIALFLGEALYKIVREEESNPSLFQFLSQSILELDAYADGVANFHLHFLTRLCAHLGYAPHLNYHPQNAPFFDIAQGFFVPSDALLGPAFSGEESALFYQFLIAPDASTAGKIALNGTQRDLFVKDIVRYLSYHLNAPLVLNAPEVLRQVLQ